MTKTLKPIVFFGSGPVAAASLAGLLQSFTIEFVVTKAVPAHHKGTAPVEELAKQHGIPLLIASTRKELDEVMDSQNFKSPIGVIVDHGVIVSQKVIDMFPLGIVNSHFSLLPQWRGADPITFSILSGQPKSGVSLMVIEPTLDTGKLITQKTLHLAPDETTPSLTKKLIELSNDLLDEYLPRYMNGEVTPRAQPHPDRATYSRKLTKADSVLDFSRPAIELEREIRAFTGWPQSRTILGNIEVVVTKAAVTQSATPVIPGELYVEKKRLSIGTTEGLLEIISLKPLGKKEMPVQAFLAGYRSQLG